MKQSELSMWIVCSLFLISISIGTNFGEAAAQPQKNGASKSPHFDLLPTVKPGTKNNFVQLDRPMKNMTKYLAENVRINCEITGSPLPYYKWMKDGVIVDEADPRVKTKRTNWGSRLRITDLMTSDSGNYTCIGSNQYDRVSISGYLRVRKVKNPNVGRDPFVDKKYTYPDPISPDYTKQDGKGRHDKRPKKEDGYDAIADLDLPKAEKKLPQERYYEEKYKGEAFCQDYRGATCSTFVGNESIYVTSLLDQANTEGRHVARMLIIASTKELSKKCQDYAVPLLCYHMFPLCDKLSEKPRPRQICKEECLELENNICRTEYILAQTQPRIDGQLVLPDCSKIAGSDDSASHNCMRVGIPLSKGALNSLDDVDVAGNKGSNADDGSNNKKGGIHDDNMDVITDETCYKDKGQAYRGRVSRTRSGYMCQNWSVNKPHSQPYSDRLVPGLDNHNYCRNPRGLESGPWCFTMNRNVIKELCDIPKCEETSGGNQLLYILIPAIGIPLIVIAILALYCVFHKRNNEKVVTSQKPEHLLELSPLTKPQPRVKDLPLSSIHFIHEMGEGVLGKVYMGDVMGLYGDTSMTRAVIKTLRENPSTKVQNDFRREVDTMSELKHPNIVCLLGVCMKQSPMSMIFECLPHGDLHDFLLRHSPHTDLGLSEEDMFVLEYTDLLHFATQIAAGMEYYAAHSFIHRDLAARNILVGDNLTLKISDFGLSKDIYSADYYRVNNQSVLPIRWMPIEAIMYGQFSNETNVWTYGVVMWEVFSYGLQPYFGYTNHEVIELIRTRQLLPCPEDCPHRVYALMVECWNELPSRRPRFHEINGRLEACKTEQGGQAVKWTSCVSQSQSAHSGSTQNSSGHSQPASRHSSTGPSTGNNTATTGLVSNMSTDVPHLPPGCRSQGAVPSYPQQALMQPVYSANMPFMSSTLVSPPPPPGSRPQLNIYSPVQSKVSPPGSIASHKSNSSGSHSSNGNPAVRGVQPFTNSHPNNHPNNHTNNFNVPHNRCMSPNHDMNKFSPNNYYIQPNTGYTTTIAEI